MPKGLYDHSVRLTAEQKKERKADNLRRWTAANRGRANALARRGRSKRKEQIAEANRQWREKNRERNLEQKRSHYAANRERLLEEKKQYGEDHREQKSAYNRKYRAENRETCRQNDHRRRALIFNSTLGDRSAIAAWEAKWSSKKTVVCHWCRKRVKTASVHVDHVIPLSKGGPHAVENLCVSCAKCNHTKHSKLPEVWNAGLSQPLLFV